MGDCVMDIKESKIWRNGKLLSSPKHNSQIINIP